MGGWERHSEFWRGFQPNYGFMAISHIDVLWSVLFTSDDDMSLHLNCRRMPSPDQT